MTLAQLVQSNTNHGHTIIEFLIDVMHGRLAHFKPCHRLSAARLLIIYGHQDAADFISDNSPPDLFTRPATRRSLRIAGVNPVLARLIKSQTDDGLRIIDFIIAVMEGRVREARPHHRMAAARDLLERGFGKCPRRSLPRPPRPFRSPTRRQRSYGYSSSASSAGKILKDLITRVTQEPTHDDARPEAATSDLTAHAIEEPDHTDIPDPDTAHPPIAQDDITPLQPDTPDPNAQHNDPEDTRQPSTEDRETHPVTDPDNHTNNPHTSNSRPLAIPTFDPNAFHY